MIHHRLRLSFFPIMPICERRSSLVNSSRLVSGPNGRLSHQLWVSKDKGECRHSPGHFFMWNVIINQFHSLEIVSDSRWAFWQIFFFSCSADTKVSRNRPNEWDSMLKQKQQQQRMGRPMVNGIFILAFILKCSLIQFELYRVHYLVWLGKLDPSRLLSSLGWIKVPLSEPSRFQTKHKYERRLRMSFHKTFILPMIHWTFDANDQTWWCGQAIIRCEMIVWDDRKMVTARSVASSGRWHPYVDVCVWIHSFT